MLHVRGGKMPEMQRACLVLGAGLTLALGFGCDARRVESPLPTTHFSLVAVPASNQTGTAAVNPATTSLGSAGANTGTGDTTPGALPRPEPGAVAAAGGGTGTGGTGSIAAGVTVPAGDGPRLNWVADPGERDDRPPPEPTQPPGCSPCADGPRTGTVLAAEDPHGPLAGVQVTAGTVTTTSAADGTFTLPPPSGSAEIVSLALAGRPASAVAGWRDGALTCHLAPAEVAPPGSDGTGGVVFFLATGRVVAGTPPVPVAGAAVLAGAPGGAQAPAVTTGPDGRFTLRVLGAPSGVATAAVVWAVTRDGVGEATQLGMLGPVDLAIQPREYDEDSIPLPPPPPQDVGDVVLAPRAADVTLANGILLPFDGAAHWGVDVVGPGGVSFAYAQRFRGQSSVPAFAPPGATLMAHAALTSYDGHSSSEWMQIVAPGDAVTPALLSAPVPSQALTVAPGAAWLFRPVAQADTYRVELLQDGASVWEAFSPLPRITLPPGVPTTAHRARIVATTEGGIFSVASLGAPRRLRVLPALARYSAWDGAL
ncbi:MAG: hypothetical protein JWM80_24 [Cyanobacteria bacterium RYN_339]|nr:hypothetical protein [Cyanobacteria bacterium RYN_339]